MNLFSRIRSDSNLENPNHKLIFSLSLSKARGHLAAKADFIFGNQVSEN